MRVTPMVTAAAIVLTPVSGLCDYAITQGGLALFNVVVDDAKTTSAGPLTVKYTGNSFSYDYAAREVRMLRRKQFTYDIDDFVRTSEITELSRDAARKVMEERGWSNHRPPAKKRLTPPPRQTPTPTPQPRVPVERDELADEALPIEERVTAQMEIFVQQQSRLSNVLNLKVNVDSMPEAEAKKQRLDLLDRQLRIFADYYDSSEEAVRTNGVRNLQRQKENVIRKGGFTFDVEF